MWLLIGAAAGAGIALLYAPKSGKDARKLLRRKAEDAREAIAETTGQIRDKVVTTGETIADAGRDVYRKASGAASAAAGVFDPGKRAGSR
jgi:gas vesicle protein